MFSIVTESERIHFNNDIKSKYDKFKFSDPELTIGNDGFILSATYNTVRFTNFYYQRSDLHLKIDENGEIVKYYILKKNIQTNLYDYRKALPVYISQSDGSLIGFFMSNPENPSAGIVNSTAVAKKDISKASTHFIHISSDLNVSKPVNVQKSVKSDIKAPYLIPQNTVVVRSSEYNNATIYISFEVINDMISLGFVTVEKD